MNQYRARYRHRQWWSVGCGYERGPAVGRAPGARSIVRGGVPDFRCCHGDGGDALELRYEDENIWLTQKTMAELYGVVSKHLQTLFESGELQPESVLKRYLMTAGKVSAEQAKLHPKPEPV